MLNQVTIQPSHLIYPIFVEEAIKKQVPIGSMPGYAKLPLSQVADEGKAALAQGVKSVLLFGIPAKKDEEGTSAYAKDGIVQKAIRELKKAYGDEFVVIGDVCLCEYMSHGHCGIVKDDEVQNDPTLELLGKIAVSYAEAGVDIVAPSAMMDGQIGVIREALDEAGYDQIPIMAYCSQIRFRFLWSVSRSCRVYA